MQSSFPKDINNFFSLNNHLLRRTIKYCNKKMCRSVSWNTTPWEVKKLSISKPSFRAENIQKDFSVYLKSYNTTKKETFVKTIL